MAPASSNLFLAKSAPLEYWFWKFHSGDLAFLVDFIVRRRLDEGEIRVSLWVQGRGRVVRLKSRTWSAGASGVSIEGHELTAEGSRGSVEDVTWDLSWQHGSHLVSSHPKLLGPLHPLDLEHLLLPDAQFSGSVTVAGVDYPIHDVPGLFMNYWGRRLGDHWCWISATEFADDPRRRVEVLVARSSLWGQTWVQVPAAYLWTADEDGSEFTISPMSGLIRQRRRGMAVEIRGIRLDGTRHRILCEADAAAFNDLGEGIYQTLLADLIFDGHHAVPERTGLEFRG